MVVWDHVRGPLEARASEIDVFIINFKEENGILGAPRAQAQNPVRGFLEARASECNGILEQKMRSEPLNRTGSKGVRQNRKKGVHLNPLLDASFGIQKRGPGGGQTLLLLVKQHPPTPKNGMPKVASKTGPADPPKRVPETLPRRGPRGPVWSLTKC